VVNDNDLKGYAGRRLDYKLDENTTLISSAGYSMIGSAREITTTFGAAQAKDWSYLNLQERLHHKNFFAQVFYDKSNSGNSDSLDANGTYYLRTGIPVVDKSSILATQVQQGLQWSRTKFVLGAEYLATRPQTQGTIAAAKTTTTSPSTVGTSRPRRRSRRRSTSWPLLASMPTHASTAISSRRAPR
jgi:hypothetical protein